MEEQPVVRPAAQALSARATHPCQAAACRRPGTELMSQNVWLCSEHAEEFLSALEDHTRLTP